MASSTSNDIDTADQIAELETEAEYAQSEGDILQAISLQERILVLEAAAYGGKSDAVLKTSKLLAELSNLQALKELDQGREIFLCFLALCRQISRMFGAVEKVLAIDRVQQTGKSRDLQQLLLLL